MPARLSPAPPEGSLPPPFRCHKTVGTLCSGCIRGGRVSAAGLPPRRGSNDNAAAGSAEAAQPRLGLAGRSRRAMAEAASAGRRHRLHPRAEGPGGARGSTRRPRSGARPSRPARGAARDDPEGHPARAAAALQGLLRGDGGIAERRLALLAARPRRVRRALRPPARARPRGEAEAVPQAEAAGRRHLSPAAPGGGGPAFRLLHRRRIRHRAARRGLSEPALPRARPLLRPAGLSKPSHGRAALARHLDLCPPPPHRRDDRLREPRRHRSAEARPAAELSCITTPQPRSRGACGRSTAATSRWTS